MILSLYLSVNLLLLIILSALELSQICDSTILSPLGFDDKFYSSFIELIFFSQILLYRGLKDSLNIIGIIILETIITPFMLLICICWTIPIIIWICLRLLWKGYYYIFRKR